MKILFVFTCFLAGISADIGLKLRQQQQQLQQNEARFGGDIRNNPFFIPKSEVGNFGGAGAAATNVEQRAGGNAKTERTHTLEELCNDAFHSFLCKPVNGKRRRIDGNLRPGAVLPPGVLRPESSNNRENKLLPPLQSGSSPLPNRSRPDTQQNDRVPAAQSEQGYFYPRPSNNFETNRPLNNGYLPPDNGFRNIPSPPPLPPIRFPIITTQPPQTTTRLPPVTFPTTRRPVVTFQTTPRPIITTRIPTTPSTIFTTQRPFFTQPIKYETFPPRQQQVFNTYLPPVTVSTTRPPTTTRVPFFTRPTPSPAVFTTRLPLQTRPPLPPSTLPPIRFSTTTVRPTFPPITFITSTPTYQTLPNTYLPPFSEQRLNPVFISTTTTTPRPTFQTVSIPVNTYLPPNNPAIDIRFGSATNTKVGSALLPDAAQNPSVAIKPEEEDNLERLCNDPFHSFLCQPITKTRYRFDGRLRPQAVIPQGILLPSSSFNFPLKLLPELQSGSDLQPTSVPSDAGYTYTNPNSIQQNSQVRYTFPTASNQQTLLLSSSQSPVTNTGYFYPAPLNNGLASLSTSLTSSQTGYEYPKPSNNQEFSIASSTVEPDLSSVTNQFTTISTTPSPLLSNSQFFQQSNGIPFQISNNQEFFASKEKTQSIQTGYQYPKPSFNEQFSLPSNTPSTASFGYVYPKTETQLIYTTSTPRPSPALETSTPTSTTLKFQPTGPLSLITGYENPNPSNELGVTISTTERPSSLGYVYQNPSINQVSPSVAPQNLINYQISTENTQNGYTYPKPDQPLLHEQTVNQDSGYYYPKPSLSFPDNSLNSIGNPQIFKNIQNPILNTFSKGLTFSLNQPSPSPNFPVAQQNSDQGVNTNTAKNINQLLGPSNESSNRDLPPASQFEILKVRKRQNG